MTNPFATAAPAAPSPAPAAPQVDGAVGIGGSDPFDSPAGPGDGAKLTDNMDALVLVRPLELIKEMPTSHGTADAIRADFWVLDGPTAGTVGEGALVFQRALVSDLTRVLNGRNPFLLGRMSRGVAKAGKSAPYIFAKPEEADLALARKVIAEQGLA